MKKRRAITALRFVLYKKVPCDYRLPVLNEKDRQYSDITKVRMASKSGRVMVEKETISPTVMVRPNSVAQKPKAVIQQTPF